jgi:hypothetical protein
MFYSWATFDGIPPRSQLKTASGPVSWVRDGKYGITFGLDGVPQSFEYASKGNAMGLVHDTLSRPERPVVTVLFDPGSPSGPIYSTDEFHSVFELSVAGRPLRSHDQIAAAWRSDENLAPWLAAIFAFMGTYLSWTAFRSRDASQ